MHEPHVPSLRRQVVTVHPIEKSLHIVIALQVVAGLGLLGTIFFARMTQPQLAVTPCHWNGDASTNEPASPSRSRPKRNHLPAPAPALLIAPCGTARVIHSGNPHALELRFDNCADGLQPEPMLLPTPTPKPTVVNRQAGNRERHNTTAKIPHHSDHGL